MRLFSTLGYNAVGVEMIAAAVNVTPPSLYKHFKGKQEILEEIVNRAEENYHRHLIPVVNFTDEEINDFDIDRFTKIVMSQIENLLHDNVIKSVRKLFIIEQYRNERIRMMHIKNTFENNEERAFIFFSKLIRVRSNKADVDIIHLAKLVCYPIISVIDRCYCDPDFEKEGLTFIRDHVRYIWRNYFE